MKQFLAAGAAGAFVVVIGFSISVMAHGSGGANSNSMPMMHQGTMGSHMHGHGRGSDYGMHDQGMMSHGGMMGHHRGMGMMGRGFGRHMMQPYRTDLSADEAKHMMKHRLEWQGYSNLKPGEVEETDDDTIHVEVVTKDGTFVQRFKIDRHSGLMEPAE